MTMKQATILCLLGWLALCTTVQADKSVEQAFVTKAFTEAGTAYDEDRVKDAIALYQSLIDKGYRSQALYYNLGNARFRAGRLGRAVLDYKRALYLTPRDPDVRANLAYAFETAGIEPSPTSVLDRVAGQLAMKEWALVALAVYWGLFLVMAPALWWPRLRPTAWKIAPALALVLAISLTGLVHWISLERSPEVVVTDDDQEVFFAPLAGSTVYFAAPEGTVLRVDDRADGWLKVYGGDRTGWIHSKACEFVAGK